MINRTTKLRWRRRMRRSRNRVEDIGTQAEEQLERHFFKRLGKLFGVRRFIISWILLLFILIVGVLGQIRNLGNYYLVSKPVPGGTFIEGEIGSFTNANPMFATTNVDSSVSRLLFASLFKFDQQHRLVGDLAESWAADDRGTTYTVKLKPELKWHDDFPLTANDVAFTYQSIQNPDVKSPLFTSWRGITVTVKDPLTITFGLPSPLSSFPYSMVNGIVPKHILGAVPAPQLRSVSFNTQNPVGAGPFRWGAIQISGTTPETRQQQIALLPNDQYYGGKAKLSKFVVRAFASEKELISSFKKREISSIAGLADIPAELTKDLSIYDYNIPLLSQVMVFFKSSQEVLKDTAVRQALVLASDTAKINGSLSHPVVPSRSPILKSQIGYDPTLNQFGFDPIEAAKRLDAAGWKLGKDGIRAKGALKLRFNLYSQESTDYAVVTKLLVEQWRKIGVDAKSVLQSDSDLQISITYRTYDALVYGIGIGGDPDVFAYWHSSQASPLVQNRLNFSDYRSPAADAALEAGRTRNDPTIRAVKYRPFLDAWRNDAPAAALYQPSYLYISRGQVFGFEPDRLVSGTDRFANVQNWMIHEERTSE